MKRLPFISLLHRPHFRWWTPYAAASLVLVVLFLISWGVREQNVAEVKASDRNVQDEAVAHALATIESDFSNLQEEMLGKARALAESPTIVEGLANYQASGRTLNETLVDALQTVPLKDLQAIEIYDRIPRLVAWRGFSMPLDPAPDGPRFLESYQTSVAEDGNIRKALVVWWPVRKGGTVLGAVRVMELVSFVAPVQNSYLHSFNLSETWTNKVGLLVEAQLGSLPAASFMEQGQARLLQGIDGTVLGRVVVQPPSREDLIQRASSQAGNLMALWGMLLLFCISAWTWRWYTRGARDSVSLSRTWLRFLVPAAVWWSVRFIFLEYSIPARWQPGKAPLAPLFDPTHLASTVGFGLLRSTGDLFITALFALIFAAALLHPASRYREPAQNFIARFRSGEGERARLSSTVVFYLTVAASFLIMALLILAAASVTHHAVLDSTHDYLARSGLFPDQHERLIVVVFCAQLLLMLAVLLDAVAVAWVALSVLSRFPLPNRSAWVVALGIILAGGLSLSLLFLITNPGRMLPWSVAALFLGIATGMALYSILQEGHGFELLSLRGVLLSIFLLSLLLYPLFYGGMDAKRRMQMIDAVETFDVGRDPRVIFSIEQVLSSARASEEIHEAFVSESGVTREQVDSLARELLRGSLLTSLGPYDVSLSLMSNEGNVLGRHYEGEQTQGQATLDANDLILFGTLREMYAETQSTDPLVEPLTGRVERERVQYAGIAPLFAQTNPEPIGWVIIRAEPQTRFASNETPFPRVLLPAGYFGNLHASLSLAHFRNEVLVRSFGREFGRYRLAESVLQELMTRQELWKEEEFEGSRFLTYYRRQDSVLPSARFISPPSGASIIAVRAPDLNIFDHLYFLLRLTVAGLFIGAPVYLIGIFIRRKVGLLPAPRIRFRDRVLNAFLAVGIISIAIVGVVGEEVVTGGTEGTVRNWLRQHLERVEETLALEAKGEELPYHVLRRTHVDSLAARVGLDINIYKGYQLVQSSRPQLVRDRLIDERLPIEAYDALYFDGQRFVVTDEAVGAFRYKAGYRAILDEEGGPGYILSVPTLPEQERIEEEQARMLAYLFGALLLLVLAVMLTASLLASALARPIGRLRAGLEAVAKGEFERTIPVSTRDEIGELVQTFNSMQQQLAESRRILAQQERQLAWREMARQVAHEIKNPLTPMKLSVQHLRRTYDTLGMSGNGVDDARSSKFSGIFDRITGTLMEQIDSLARIANEFHSFARMPSRVLERLDLNHVVEEAVALMQADTDVVITATLSPKPLIVEADHEELRRTFINLIKNAIESIPEEVKGRVWVRTEHQASQDDGPCWALASVQDNGSGVPVELRDRLFEPNFSTKTSGTGLGLAIARKCIEDLKGEISFDTVEGEGTTFRVRLPLVKEND